MPVNIGGDWQAIDAFDNNPVTLFDNDRRTRHGSFVGKWQERLESDNALVRYKARQFIGILAESELITEFDVELYSALVEKMTVFDGGRVVVSLLDGTEVECGV